MKRSGGVCGKVRDALRATWKYRALMNTGTEVMRFAIVGKASRTYGLLVVSSVRSKPLTAQAPDRQVMPSTSAFTSDGGDRKSFSKVDGAVYMHWCRDLRHKGLSGRSSGIDTGSNNCPSSSVSHDQTNQEGKSLELIQVPASQSPLEETAGPFPNQWTPSC